MNVCFVVFLRSFESFVVVGILCDYGGGWVFDVGGECVECVGVEGVEMDFCGG